MTQHLTLIHPFHVEVKHGRVRFEFAKDPSRKSTGYELDMSYKVARELADQLNITADKLDPEG